MNSKALVSSKLFLGVVAIVVIAGAYFFVSAKFNNKPTSTLGQVSIISLKQGGVYPVNTAIPVKATFPKIGDYSSFRLLVDGKKVEEKKIGDVGVKASTIEFFWQPDSKGNHSVEIQALDKNNHKISSPKIKIKTELETSASIFYSTDQGDTIESIATKLRINPEEIIRLNPVMEKNGTLKAGQNLQMPINLPKFSQDNKESVSGLTETQAGIKVVADKIIFPRKVSVAYFYYTLDKQNWLRAPADKNVFIQVPNGEIDVKSLVAIANVPQGNKIRQVEGWGWNKGELVNLGKFDFDAEPILAQLFACSPAGGCSGDFGWQRKEVDVAKGGNNEKVKFSWNASKETDGGLVQISQFPFSSSSVANYKSRAVPNYNFYIDFQNPLAQSYQLTSMQVESSLKLIAQKRYKSVNTLKDIYNNSAQANPNLSLDHLSDLQLATSSNNNFVQANLSNIPLSSNTYYTRLFPIKYGEIAGPASESVKINRIESQGTINPEFHSPEAIYDVKIKNFKPLRGPMPGICNHAMILDTDWPIYDAFHHLIQTIPAGSRLCPESYQGIGEQSWYESLWNFVSSGISWAAELYNSIKSAIVNAVGGFLCAGDADCMAFVATGIDIGLVALGIPPELPNFDQLMNQGFDYLASEIARQAGCPDVACKELIKAGLHEAIDSFKNTNPSCGDEEAMHNLGIEPLCLPAGVTAHLDPLGTYRNAEVTIEVTRNNKPITDPIAYGMYKNKYAMQLHALAYNDKVIGHKIINIEPYGKSLTITEPLEGLLFNSAFVSIPPLENPGDKYELPIQFVAQEYWVPGHKDLMGGWTTVVYKDGWPQYQYDDWWLLYYGADLTLNASIVACDPYTNSACVSSQQTQYHQIPNTLNP